MPAPSCPEKIYINLNFLKFFLTHQRHADTHDGKRQPNMKLEHKVLDLRGIPLVEKLFQGPHNIIHGEHDQEVLKCSLIINQKQINQSSLSLSTLLDF